MRYRIFLIAALAFGLVFSTPAFSKSSAGKKNKKTVKIKSGKSSKHKSEDFVVAPPADGSEEAPAPMNTPKTKSKPAKEKKKKGGKGKKEVPKLPPAPSPISDTSIGSGFETSTETAFDGGKPEPGSGDPGTPIIKDADEPFIAKPQGASWNQVRDIFSPYKQAAKPKLEKKTLATISLKRRVPVLQGVLKCSDDDEIAIIDDQMVRKGREIDGFKVARINKNSVVLNYDGEEMVLNVKE